MEELGFVEKEGEEVNGRDSKRRGMEVCGGGYPRDELEFGGELLRGELGGYRKEFRGYPKE